MKKYTKPICIFIIIFLMLGVLFLKTPTAVKLDEDKIFDIASTYDARIIRDDFGVPHIFGETDADCHIWIWLCTC